MSKAFKPDDGADNEEELPDEPQDQRLPPGTKNYMTPAGAARMREELRKLLHEVRPEVVRVVAWAASNGDRSENADYQYGKRRLREIDRRIRFLERRLALVEVVDPKTQHGNKARFGATVTVRHEDGTERTHAIVGVDEIDPSRGRISWNSPVGRALLGKAPGDTVTVRTPRGEEDLEVVAVRFEELP
jgi:transcription elongation factor GreB